MPASEVVHGRRRGLRANDNKGTRTFMQKTFREDKNGKKVDSKSTIDPGESVFIKVFI